MLTKFGLCYTMRENVKIRKMHILFILYIYWPSYATFSMMRFLLTSVYNVRALEPQFSLEIFGFGKESVSCIFYEPF